MASLRVTFSSEELAELTEIAAAEGVAAEQFVRDVALRTLQEEAELKKLLDARREKMERGESLSSEEVWARIERLSVE
jgi:hypothetical protein